MDLPIHQLMDPPRPPFQAPGSPELWAFGLRLAGGATRVRRSARHGEAPQTFGHRSQRRGKATSRPGAGGGKFFAVKCW